MKKILRNVMTGMAALVFLFIGLVIIPYFTNTLMPWERANAIETTLQWGGLSELPVGVEIVRVETEGSMFTRTFLLEFNLSNGELREWISSSKRLKDKSPILDKDGTKLYEIYPGEEGSIGGTVRIDPEIGSVKIIMAWS